jgi:Ribbon-helix-helix protein, copG family
LREDVLDALQKHAKDEDLSISRMIERAVVRTYLATSGTSK